jgi:hypothetical protein
MAAGALDDPCSRCGRTLIDLRRGASREALRGSAPLCSLPGCPLVQRVLGFAREPPRVSGRELQGPSPPAVFVGRHGYPDVQLGPLLPALPEAVPEMGDTPTAWLEAGMGIGDILQMRGRLLRSKARMSVTAPRDASHALETSRELAMAARPVETEITLAKPVKLTLGEPKVDPFAAPMGPSVDVVGARVVSHPSVPRKVDALVSDVHADAATGATELYEGGITPYHIQRLLSVGLLGEERRRRLVPTRWSITATDDILGKQLIEDVKEQPLVDAPQVFASELFGNHFHVLLIEAWHEDGAWMLGHDLESYHGRTGYADSITGAYYAARLSVLEHLVEKRRQASVFVYREITDEYWAPLGVWVIREAVKAAMATKGLVFGDVESALRHIRRRSRDDAWTRVAVLPKEARQQRTLRDFFGA